MVALFIICLLAFGYLMYALILLNASLILIMIAILRVFLTKLFYMIKFLSE